MSATSVKTLAPQTRCVMALFDESQVRKTLAQFIKPNSVFELRALDAQLFGNRRTATISGYFDNIDACISELEKLRVAKGVYFTANPVNHALLARRANRLDYAEKNATTSDQHILQRCWLPVDIDPDRPSGISASDAEKGLAHRKAGEIYSYLMGRGWPEPVAGDSGNGYHLLFPIDLPTEDDGLIEKTLKVIANRFDGDGVKIDSGVFNPARIVRLYGTLAAKGDNTKERPHRLSKILKSPQALEVVSADQLRSLVNELQAPEPAPVADSAGRNRFFDVEGFLSRHGVTVAEKTVDPDGTTKWRLEQCPFNPDHTSPDAAVFQFPDGRLGFDCRHTSCSEKHWRDFRRHFEPEATTTKSSPEKPKKGKGKKESAASQLVAFVIDQSGGGSGSRQDATGGRQVGPFSLFHDPHDRAFARYQSKDHVEIWPVESAKFRKILARLYYNNTGAIINRNALADAITTLAGLACHDSPEETIFLRVAPYGDDILIDLCDQKWRAVLVTATGWQILETSPIAFVRTGSMRALPEPRAGGGSIEPLWNLLNVTEAQRPLVAGALLNGFHPFGPYFVSNYVGEHGSAKSSAARIHRQLIDPNQNPLRSPPKEENDLFAQAVNNRCVALDNLSHLPLWLSDALCRIATGGGLSKRTLYTDTDETSQEIKRPVIINGIEDVATRPDLADRVLQIELDTIPNKRRITEKVLLREFETARPAIFTAMLDSLSMALRTLPELKMPPLPRMADAAEWATAGETAFGFERWTFLKAYQRNLDESAELAVDANPVGAAIRILLEKQDQWEGEARELLGVLVELVSDKVQKQDDWPNNPQKLGHVLRKIAPALRRAGIRFARARSKHRKITLSKAPEKSAETDENTDADSQFHVV